MIKLMRFSLFVFPYLSLLITGYLPAQNLNSVYSMFGVGQIIDNHYGINRSMGGTGIAFQSGRSINYLNPASYLGIPPDSYSMELGAYGIYSRSKNMNTYQTDGNINLSYLSASFYLKKNWAFSFGIVPYSKVNYEIHSTAWVDGDLSTYNKKYTGNGGLNRIYFGNAFHIYKGLSLGFNTSLIFGTITKTETTVSEADFTGYELKNVRQAYGFYFDYGLQYRLKKDEYLLTLGLIYGAAKALGTTDSLEFVFDDAGTTLDKNYQADIEIPQKLGLGISLKKGNQFKIGFDYEFRNWAAVDYSDTYSVVNNSNRYSVGLEYHPFQHEYGRFYEKMYYRLGAYYLDSYLEVDHIPINSAGFSFGFGIPVHHVNTLNLSFEYGNEGTLSEGLIQNNYWGFYLNFTLCEFWAKNSF